MVLSEVERKSDTKQSTSCPSESMQDKQPISDRRERFVHLGLGWLGDRGGGLERYQHGICTTHASMGVDVTAWVQSRTGITNNPNYEVVAFASQEDRRRDRLAKLRRLASEQFASDPCLLVSHHASVSAALAGILVNRPHVVHFQGPWADEAAVEGASWWKTSIQRRHERIAYHSADRIITLSTAFRDVVIDRYDVDPDRVEVVPGGIDAVAADPGVSRNAAREKLGWPTDRPILVSIRRLVRRVGVDVLLDAVARIVERHNDLLVMIGGTGPLRKELEHRIETSELSRNVRLLGYVSEEDLPLAYRAADYSIVPTQELEGFGLVVIESLAAGTPALVTPIGSLPEVVRDLNESLILPGKSSDQIADGVEAVLEGKIAMPTETECRKYVKQHFDWTVIGPKVLAVYREALK